MFNIELRPSLANSNDHALHCLMKLFEQREKVVVPLCIVPRKEDRIEFKGQTLHVHSVCLHIDTGHGEVVAHAYVGLI